MTKPRLHLDEDTSDPRLEKELLKHGHDVTRTPNDWIQLSASDEEQLERASKQGRSLFSYNSKDFMRIAKKTPKHKGIILSPQISLQDYSKP